MTAAATSDVFVSYKAEDRARLRPLVAALEAEGFSVWWDAHIGGGTNWRKDIEEHLNAAKCVIVAWTKRSVGEEGEFVRDEATRARRRGAYLPVRLDAVEPPLGFGEVQAVSLQGWKGDAADPRFRAVVDAVRSRISGEKQAPARTYFSPARISRRTAIAGGAGAVALAGAAGWFLLKPAPANAKRIAVLPFANLSGDEKQEYFSEGVAEELRAALSRIQLEVIGRSSSEAVKDMDTKAAASKLGVANILTGSVRRSPETIRISAQLVSGSDGVERWAQSYDRAPGDAIKIQSDIAANVAQALRVALGRAQHAALTLGGTSDSFAQDLLLQARKASEEAMGAEGLHEVLKLLTAAITRDPDYADAYVERSGVLAYLGGNYPEGSADKIDKLARAEADARRALAIAPGLGKAHSALGFVELVRLNFKSSYRHMLQALALSPEDPHVIGNAASKMAAFGDGRRAVHYADRLVELDPLDAGTYQIRAVALWSSRRFAQAIDAAHESLELSPNSSQVHYLLAMFFVALNDFAKAKAEYERLPAGQPLRMSLEGVAAARSGDKAGAERTIARMRQLFGAAYSVQYADIYAQAGDNERAFAELDNAWRAKDPGLAEMKSDPFLDPIRNDPRYAALVRKLNFP